MGALSTFSLKFTHNEIQRPTAAHRWQFALRDVSHRQSCFLSTPNHPLLTSSQPPICLDYRSAPMDPASVKVINTLYLLTRKTPTSRALPRCWCIKLGKFASKMTVV